MLMEHSGHGLDCFTIMPHLQVVYAFLPAKNRATYERRFTLILALKRAIQLTCQKASFKGC